MFHKLTFFSVIVINEAAWEMRQLRAGPGSLSICSLLTSDYFINQVLKSWRYQKEGVVAFLTGTFVCKVRIGKWKRDTAFSSKASFEGSFLDDKSSPRMSTDWSGAWEWRKCQSVIILSVPLCCFCLGRDYWLYEIVLWLWCAQKSL